MRVDWWGKDRLNWSSDRLAEITYARVKNSSQTHHTSTLWTCIQYVHAYIVYTHTLYTHIHCVHTYIHSVHVYIMYTSMLCTQELCVQLYTFICTYKHYVQLTASVQWGLQTLSAMPKSFGALLAPPMPQQGWDERGEFDLVAWDLHPLSESLNDSSLVSLVHGCLK